MLFQPEGFKEQENLVCKLNKYDLKWTPKCSCKRFPHWPWLQQTMFRPLYLLQ